MGLPSVKCWLLLSVLGLCSCGGEFPENEPPAPNIRRLTAVQYANVIHDVFGAEVVVPGRLEPDSSFDGFISIGSALTTISPRGVELYESASYQILEQVFEDEALRERVLTCSPGSTAVVDSDPSPTPDTDQDSAIDSDTDFGSDGDAGDTPDVFIDEACIQTVIEVYGRRLWRRPLTSDETQGLVEVASIASTTLGGADVGLQYALAALLQSPYFLFRIELGEPDPERAGEFRYNDFEMASKLSFFFWNTGPDAELLDVAEEGLLTTDEGLEEQVERLMSSYKSREGFRSFVDEYLELHELDQLKKDSLFFTHMDVTVGPSARERDVDELRSACV